MNKPHNKIYKKIRETIEEGQKELKDREVPTPIIKELDNLKSKINTSENDIEKWLKNR